MRKSLACGEGGEEFAEGKGCVESNGVAVGRDDFDGRVGGDHLDGHEGGLFW